MYVFYSVQSTLSIQGHAQERSPNLVLHWSHKCPEPILVPLIKGV